MTFSQICNILKDLPQNPVPKSSVNVDFQGERILIDTVNPKALNLEEAKLLVGWLVDIIGGRVTWSDTDSANKYTHNDHEHLLDAMRYAALQDRNDQPDPVKKQKEIEKIEPKTTVNGQGNAGSSYRKPKPVSVTKPAQYPLAVKSEGTYVNPENRLENVLKRVRSFRDINNNEMRGIRGSTPYSPVKFQLKPEDFNRLRSIDEVTEHEKIMIFEDYYYAGMCTKDMEEKYGLNRVKVKSILTQVINEIKVRPSDYKPIFVSIPEVTSVYGIEMRKNIKWANVDNSKIKRIESKNIPAIIEQDKARMDAKLSRIQVVIRKCLVCDAMFESFGERTCGCSIEKRRSFLLEDKGGVTL